MSEWFAFDSLPVLLLLKWPVLSDKGGLSDPHPLLPHSLPYLQYPESTRHNLGSSQRLLNESMNECMHAWIKGARRVWTPTWPCAPVHGWLCDRHLSTKQLGPHRGKVEMGTKRDIHTFFCGHTHVGNAHELWEGCAFAAETKEWTRTAGAQSRAEVRSREWAESLPAPASNRAWGSALSQCGASGDDPSPYPNLPLLFKPTQNNFLYLQPSTSI